jgi:hypothetical protein
MVHGEEMEETLEKRGTCPDCPGIFHPYHSPVTAAYRRTFSWVIVFKDGWKDLLIWMGNLFRRDPSSKSPGYESLDGNTQEHEEIRSWAYLDIHRRVR